MTKAQQPPIVAWGEDQISSSNIVVHAPKNTIYDGFVYGFEGYMGYLNGVYQFLYTGNVYFQPQTFPLSPSSGVGRYWAPYHLHKAIVRKPIEVQFKILKPVQFRMRYPSGVYSPYQPLMTGATYGFTFTGTSQYWIELNDANGRVTIIHYLP
ncbi:MAG: hypothetical protein KBD00_02485 [Candidatus Peribacteraceae bacterium]|nr:hypothetical protein [Candidatus Peribacteraceae bacterium]